MEHEKKLELDFRHASGALAQSLEEVADLHTRLQFAIKALWYARKEFEFNGLYDDADNMAEMIKIVEGSNGT